MATTNTQHTYLWYIRKKGKNHVLGLIDEDGSAISTASLNIEYWYDEIPDEVLSNNDTIPLPVEFEHSFAMGCVYEILRMNGVKDMNYRLDFEEGIKNAINRQIEESQQPSTIRPYDIRMDSTQFRTNSPLK